MSQQIEDSLENPQQPLTERQARLEELSYEIEAAKEAAQSHGGIERYKARLSEAEENYLLASEQINICSQSFYSHIIKAQVACDYVLEPNADPLIGWVQYFNSEDGADSKRVLICDTQLYRLYFNLDNGLTLTEFDYKPRKVNLFAEASSYQYAPQFALVKNLSEIANYRQRQKLQLGKSDITRYTQDLLSVRSIFPLQQVAEDNVYAVVEVVSHAGIGGHAYNSNSGFNLEFCLSEKQPGMLRDELFVVTVPYCIPSGSLEALIIRPLMSFAGLEERITLNEGNCLIQASAKLKELHGIRLNDEQARLTIDLTSSELLNAIYITKIPHNPFLLVNFVYQARQLTDTYPSKLLHFSIF